MRQRQTGIVVDQAAGHDQVPGHCIGVRLVETQQVPADRRIEVRRFDVLGQVRLVRPGFATRSRSTLAATARAESTLAATATRSAPVSPFGSVASTGRARAPIVTAPIVAPVTGAPIVPTVVVCASMRALAAGTVVAGTVVAGTVVAPLTVGPISPVPRRAIAVGSLRAATPAGVVRGALRRLASPFPAESAVLAATIRSAGDSLPAILAAGRAPVATLAALAAVSASRPGSGPSTPEGSTLTIVVGHRKILS
ncbi:hypothetical protein A4U64_10520 [Rhodococcus sp. WB1]|nr:hypothetical protein A4U64_10520 [Rhodococcus sp. WB1]